MARNPVVKPVEKAVEQPANVRIINKLAPDQQPLKPLQAKRLAAMTGVPAEALVKKTVADLAVAHKFVIDPELFLFRRICGKVVKKDAASGEEFPVPYATVHVWDTDLTALLYAPGGWPWNWFFPLHFNKEEIGHAQTNACGEFCVLVPRWDIDWILEWRKRQVCFPIIFRKPNLGDVLKDPRLDKFITRPPIKWPPDPEPGPWEVNLKDGGMPLKITTELVGQRVASRLATLDAAAGFGVSRQPRDAMLQAPAFDHAVPPPMPAGISHREMQLNVEKNAAGSAAMTMKLDLGLSPDLVEKFNPNYYIGPFMRCFTYYTPEWTPIVDIPDITFTVNQDTNNDGVEELIYGESFFDVRWDAGPLPDVKLVAWENAIASLSCDIPHVDDCGTTNILLAGKMPLHNLPAPAVPYIDSEGLAHRVNRPRTGGDPYAAPNGEALSPFCGSFPLIGCNHLPGATYYRLVYEFKAPGSSVFTATTPFTNSSWMLYRWTTHLESRIVAPDAQGWYAIIPTTDNWMPDHLLLNWITSGYSNGIYRVTMQFANASKTIMPAANQSVMLQLDNSAPLGTNNGFTGLRYHTVGLNDWHDLSLVCPVVKRTAGQDLEFEVNYQVSMAHWRSLYLSASGCGGASAMIQTSGDLTTYRWHADPNVNSHSDVATFKLDKAMPQGAYGFHLRSDSRAFNPDDSNGIVASVDWFIDPLWIYNWFDLQVAVVDV